MPSISDQLTPNAAELHPVVDRAAVVLMGLLHCGEAEARALLQAQAEAANIGVVQVAMALLEHDSPAPRWDQP